MDTKIIIYGADWCRDCIRSKAIFQERNIEYVYQDITDPEKGKEYLDIVTNLNSGKRIIQTIIVRDKHYANPSPSELHTLLDRVIENN